MSKFISQTIFTVLSVILLAGCQQDRFDDESNESILRFRCDSIATRAAGYTQSGQDVILSMGVYAAHTDNDWNGSTPLNFMQNRKIERSDASSPWSYSPEAYWPGSGKTTFFAYAPYDALGVTLSGTTGVPQLKFTVDATSAGQIDLLTAIPLKNLTQTTSPGGYATFMLRHALTRISFAAKTAMPTTNDVRITGITLADLHNSGTCSMDATNRQWTLDTNATADASYTLSSTTSGGLKDAPLTDEYETITAEDGNLFLLPQVLSESAKVIIAYTNNGEEGTPVIIKLTDVLAQWQPGEAIRFLINIQVDDPSKPFDVEINYNFVPWDNNSTDVEIQKDPFLYVTDVTTYAYDAAITRVYFYTNELPEKVYIDPVGRVGSLSGITMNVKDEFYALVQGDPDGTTHFTFNGATHQGWFDLINRHTTTADTKQPIILKLRAGKLERYITVQPIISTEIAKKNTTRYIGTFHRRNEMGERIITWHMNSDITWTATIDNTVGNYNDLAIDRMASPDYNGNLLYSFIPRNAEGAKVEPETSVSGKGRVYFRVGWKSTSPTSNRYARIKVEYSGTGAPTAADILYCRQGEEPDHLASVGLDNSFTVYNLAGDGIFTDFPTQGGFISQWGRPRLWPLVGDAAPAGYPLTPNTEDINPDVNICPERYAYPDRSTIQDLQTGLSYLQPAWGYYADGFFDRRSVAEHRVDNTSVNVASAGILLSVATNSHSVFLPTAGYRDETGVLLGKGTTGGYWAGYQESEGSQNAVALKIFNGSTASDVKGYDKRNSFFLRCIKIANAVVLYFDANGGDNAPRPVSTKQNAIAHIPSAKPDGYWKENYIFEAWNTQKDGKGTNVQPGSNYQMGTADQTLYAKWVPDFYKVNFRSYMSESDQGTYLLPTSGLLTSYDGYTIEANGAKLSAATYLVSQYSSDLPAVAGIEKAYGHLEFSQTLSSGTWNEAYQQCKALQDDWRLPRTIELMLVAQNDNVKDAILGTNTLWSGTEGSKTEAYKVLNGWAIIAQKEAKTTQLNYRCVRELKK